MITISREEFKTDPVFFKVFQTLRMSHVVSGHTSKVLHDNKNVKDFCEEARHFGILPGKETLHLHYDVLTWLVQGSFKVKIESIAFYDSYLEYESARIRNLQSTSFQNGLHHN